MAVTSFVTEGAPPSAIISDGLTTVPLYAVTQVSLNETYHLPPIGSSGLRAAVGSHDDTVTLSGLLVGKNRFDQKQQLESLAESAKKGSPLQAAGALVGLNVTGLVLVTRMTIRTDMQIQSLTFGVSSTKRGVIDVTISMAHVPPPGALSKLLDLASLGIAALADTGG